MPLTSSNTFEVPKSTQFLATSRSQWNKTFTAVRRNFPSANAAPDTSNILFEGTNQAPGTGTLWYNETTQKLYVQTGSAYSSTSPVFTGFTRLGLGTTTIDAIGNLSLGQYDPGELVAVVNDTAGDSANNRLYMISEVAGTKRVIDVGTPGAGTASPESMDDELGAIVWTAFMQN